MFAKVFLNSGTLGRMTPSDVRGWASTRLPMLPPAVFNRGDDGRELNGQCPFTLVALPGGVGIFAVGPACGVLLGELLSITKKFSADYPGGSVRMETGNVIAEQRPWLLAYEVRDLVVQTRGGVNSDLFVRWRAQPASVDFNQVVKGVLEKHIAARAAIAGLELPADAMFGDFEFSPEPRPVYAGAKARPVLSVGGTFRTNVFLGGPWYVGPLASKGCGRLRLRRQAGKGGES